MQVFEIWFRNQQLGESENWQTDISVKKKGELYSFPAQYKCIEEFNAQEQVWQATCASIGKAIDFAKFIAGVSDLHPSNSSHDDEINETRLYFEYKINQSQTMPMQNQNNQQRILVLCTFVRQDKVDSWDEVSTHQRLFSVAPPVKVEQFQDKAFILKHCKWEYTPYYVGLGSIFKLDEDVFQHDMEVINL